MNPGTLKWKIVVQQNTPTRNSPDDGELIDSWSTYRTLMAAISTIGGREFYQARGVNSELSHEVTVRYHPEIKPKMRVTWGTRVLDIVSVRSDEEGRTKTLLYCKESNG